MNVLKKSLALGLALLLTLSLAACSGSGGTAASEKVPEKVISGTETPAVPSSDSASQPEDAAPQEQAPEGVTLSAAALKGPTAMGLVYLLDMFGVVEVPQEEPLSTAATAQGNSFNFMLAASADEISPLLIKGDLDMACVPANLASVLYNRTEGQIVTLGINTLGVLYIVENGETVQSMADLKGKIIVAAGKGQIPEYGLRYLLAQNGIDPDDDVTIEWKSEHSECVAAMATGAASIALLPQPFVTVAQGKIEGLRTALDLTAEWDALENGSAMITGVVVARRDVVENHPEAVEDFMNQYEMSVGTVQRNFAEAAALIGTFGIVDTAVAEKALPYCNIVCITGEEMQEKLSGYLEVLFEQDAASVGGALPGDDFYYGA